MLWIGLTGGIATGKSTVSGILRRHGLDVIDADQLARDVVKSGTPGHAQVVKAFGPDALGPDGELNRKKIGELVFSDRLKLSLLEGIIHPLVREAAVLKQQELSRMNKPLAFYDVPLLFEKKMEAMFDKTVSVICPRDVQLERLMSRDGLPKIEAERRLAAQLPIDEKAQLSDYVIQNNSGLKELEEEVSRFLSKLGYQAQT